MRLFLSLLAALVAFLALGSVASATPPSDLVPVGPSLPACMSTASDTSGAHQCFVAPRFPGWQASTGEWIVVRLGDLEPTQSLCLQMQASVVATNTLDGQSLPVDTIPCHQIGTDQWFVDWRSLSTPLMPGDHTFTVSWYFTQTVDGIANAGQTWQFPTQMLTVIPQG